MRRGLSLVALALVLTVGASCGGEGEGPVAVSLTEHEIEADPASVPAGEVTFDVSNDGEETHEIVVVSTDLAPDELPTADDGSFDEEQVEVVNEIEDIEAGADETLTVELEAGSYVLACNVVEEEDGETEAHYELGMHTAFDVT